MTLREIQERLLKEFPGRRNLCFEISVWADGTDTANNRIITKLWWGEKDMFFTGNGLEECIASMKKHFPIFPNENITVENINGKQ